MAMIRLFILLYILEHRPVIIAITETRLNSKPYYDVLEFLKLKNILKFKITIFVYKIINYKNSVPSISLDAFTLASDTHNYNTRYIL